MDSYLSSASTKANRNKLEKAVKVFHAEASEGIGWAF
jgi:hypothetical protein